MKKFWYIVRNFVLALFLLSLGSVGTFGVTALIYLIGLFLFAQKYINTSFNIDFLSTIYFLCPY